MKPVALICLVIATLLTGCGTTAGDAAAKAYQRYDRSHARKIEGSYDADTNTYTVGYSITPVNPMQGYAK